MQDDFSTAAERVKTLKTRPSNEHLLELYALYKQATVGDVNTSQPWAVQMEARAKWDAWNAKKGQGQQQRQCTAPTALDGPRATPVLCSASIPTRPLCAGVGTEEAKAAYIKLANELIAADA